MTPNQQCQSSEGKNNMVYKQDINSTTQSQVKRTAEVKRAAELCSLTNWMNWTYFHASQNMHTKPVIATEPLEIGSSGSHMPDVTMPSKNWSETTALTLITDCQEAHEDHKNLTSAIHKFTTGRILKDSD